MTPKHTFLMTDASLRARRRFESSFLLVIRLLRSRSNGATSSPPDVDVPSPGNTNQIRRKLILYSIQ